MISRLTFALRFLLTAMGAVGLLVVLSYPDSFLPPSVDIAYVNGWTIYDAKPFMWLAPLLFMELVSCCGGSRNKVWFGALGLVFVLGLAVWPVLEARAPEWVHPTLPFEDGKLAVGMGYYSLIMMASYIIRKVLLGYLFREPMSEGEDPAAMDAAVLDPAKARSVREIAANPVLVQPKFRFGEADHDLISRFYSWMSRLRQSENQRTLIRLFAAVALVLWFFFYPQPSEQQALQRDMEAMYEHITLPDGTCRATHRAVHAAYRVLKYVADHELFAGMSPKQAEEWLHVSRAPAAYRRLLLDDSDISLPSVDDMFESRTRFFTVQDGKRIVVLYIRTNNEGDRINVSEVQDAGWNAVMDDRRRRFGVEVMGDALK